MIDAAGLRARIGAIMAIFPSETGEVYRDTTDAYGQPTGTRTHLGSVTFWRKQPNTPNAWKADEKGTTYAEDNPAWACMMWSEDLPDARRGDVLVSGGKTYRIGNRENRMNVRVYWQLREE